ncbi:MAG: hypothetical protein KGZ81_07340 [Flavobacteriales bacterium]|nr:hypothetical protein [Flavobacteriales bacterium]
MTTPQHKDTTLEQILGDYRAGVIYNMPEAEGIVRKALLQWRDKAVVEERQEIVYEIMRGEHGHDEQSIVKSLQASLNTEGESNAN